MNNTFKDYEGPQICGFNLVHVSIDKVLKFRNTHRNTICRGLNTQCDQSLMTLNHALY